MAKEPSPSSATKYFVLDTNVLLHNPNALFAFADNTVIIPFDVLEELDKFKKDSTDVGRAARTAIRHIDNLRHQGHLADGVRWNGHGGLWSSVPGFCKAPQPDGQAASRFRNRSITSSIVPAM